MTDAARLRVPCDPDAKVQLGEHKHRCDCGCCWKHDGEDFNSRAEFKVAHTCPDCGADVRRKHFANETDKLFEAFAAWLDGD